MDPAGFEPAASRSLGIYMRANRALYQTELRARDNGLELSETHMGPMTVTIGAKSPKSSFLCLIERIKVFIKVILFNDCMVEEQHKRLIKKLTLLNAVKHDGQAQPGAIVGGVLGDFPELKKEMKSLMEEISSMVKYVNSLDAGRQEAELLVLDSKALDKKEHVVDLFGFLGIKEGEKVVTAFPPGPEKHPHIGHAKALLLNYLLAHKYGGEFILRFEDTNPELVKAEFYGIMLKDFEWLGASWSKVVYASDYMDLYYKHIESLLKNGNAYVSTSSQEDIRKSRETGEPLPERNQDVLKNFELWNKMKDMKKGEAVVLLKIDLKHKNSTMRDPVVFRIIDEPHARHKTLYSVWPNYDFQNAIMDGFLGITHRLRSKEFEMRNELQRYIQNLLGYNETKIYEFARFNLKGVESSGRKIRELIQKGEISGWDDPSLTTIAALRRRGFQADAIKDFVVKTGITKSESTLTWDDLIVHNKRILDPVAERYFFVENPVELKIKGAPSKSFELNLHPDSKKGGRKFKTDEDFLISEDDYGKLKKGEIYRFMECLNFRFGDISEFVDESVETYKKQGKGMLHFLPKNADNVSAEVLMSDKKIRKGMCEQGITNVSEGSVVQFERFGFTRLDNKKEMKFWFTH